MELASISLYAVMVQQVSSAMLAVIFWVAWMGFGRKTHFIVWSLAFLISTLQWVLATQGSQFFSAQPLQDVHWWMINTLGLLFVSLLFVGHWLRAGLDIFGVSFKILIGVALLVEFLLGWYAFFDPQESLRVVIIPVYVFILLGWSAILIVYHGPPKVSVEWAVTLVILLYAFLQLGNTWFGLEESVALVGVYGFYSTLVEHLALPAVFISMGLFTFLLLASDLSQEVKRQSITDLLTGTLNRMGMEEAMRPAYSQARRYEQPLSVVMTDIDYFKTINEDYGHITGDNALSIFAITLKDELRTEDVVGRTGGEEFIMILPNTDLAEAKVLIERLRHVVASTLITTNEYKFNMTASFGLAVLVESDEDIEDAIQRADKALYRSKELGRNRVEVYEDVVDAPIEESA